MHNFRETHLTIDSHTFTVRTEIGGAVKTQAHLEAAHFKAVKGAITSARMGRVEERYRDMLPTERGAKRATADARKVWTSKGGTVGEYARQNIDSAADRYRERNQKHADEWRAKEAKRVTPKSPPFQDARKLRKPATFAIKSVWPEIPESVREFADNEGETS